MIGIANKKKLINAIICHTYIHKQDREKEWKLIEKN